MSIALLFGGWPRLVWLHELRDAFANDAPLCFERRCGGNSAGASHHSMGVVVFSIGLVKLLAVQPRVVARISRSQADGMLAFGFGCQTGDAFTRMMLSLRGSEANRSHIVSLATASFAFSPLIHWLEYQGCQTVQYPGRAVHRWRVKPLSGQRAVACKRRY